MRLLGAGRCSAVLALSEEEAHEWSYLDQAELRCHFALRICKTNASECPTCCHVLTDFLGFRYKIALTDELRTRCTLSCPLLADHFRAARSAYLIPNFAIDPSVFSMRSAHAEDARWLVLEIKPKGAWQKPHIVGVVVDGIEHYLHSVKLHQCRFSLMQVLKRERQNKAHVNSSIQRCEYCPNQLLMGDQSSIASGLRHLLRHPANNFRIIHAEGFPKGLDEGALCVVSSALYHSGVFPILAKLQLYGGHHSSQWDVLDIELLYHWSCAHDASSVRWIVVDTHATPTVNVNCDCQSSFSSQGEHVNSLGDIGMRRYIVPQQSLEESLDRFYVSMSAKDVSVLIALSTSVTTNTSTLETSAALLGPNQGDVRVTRSKLPHGGVLMEFGVSPLIVCRIGVVDVDAKRHKSIADYYALDRDVLAAWERE